MGHLYNSHLTNPEGAFGKSLKLITHTGQCKVRFFWSNVEYELWAVVEWDS